MMKYNRILDKMLLAVGLSFGLNIIEIPNSKAGLEAGKTAPAFKLPSLDGKEIALQDFIGKVVIVHLWKCQ